MRYSITHQIIYSYARSVGLNHHFLQLRPRCDVTQKLHQFALEITPTPTALYEAVDLDGNTIVKAAFAQLETSQLLIQSTSDVETFRTNPFSYLLEPWALTLPIDYPSVLWQHLQPYLGGQLTGGLATAIDPVAAQLAQEIWQATSGNVVAFLSHLNQQIYQSCGYTLREIGSPYPPAVTWNQKTGSCRDYTVLFMEVCRAVGLATRFVSGYQEGDVDSKDRHLHAWAEVYLPGAGWRGYDPTHGLAVADRHIALVATPTAQNSAPVRGDLKQAGITSDLSYELTIQFEQTEPVKTL